jgi:hypothetical protein
MSLDLSRSNMRFYTASLDIVIENSTKRLFFLLLLLVFFCVQDGEMKGEFFVGEIMCDLAV